ncbi:ImpA family type VI secretion system protein [Tabrizicola sp.]|uniref:type VI secretion system protein TssA n=1 Tax=Tabrizicola sp. TaxID=2005166 RepID=UPI002732BF03|nr:type VI secretion system ImpA family N-terminal domain-containing protein [Tabrizicola sp.]MDP3195617.1 type VI secretion system ImpA family N-terminal domain-containing protein [Tabrizicola sp.]
MELEPFLVPVGDGNASGLDLRNDPRFHGIERLVEPAARAVRVENVRSGGIGGVNIDWSGLLDQAVELAATGRDIRLLVIVVRTLANAEGFTGLTRGLDLLTATVEQYWDSLHPLLRESPSPREAATRRINSLFQLENADNGLLCDLEFAVVLSPRGIGPITGADLCAGGLTRNQAQSELPSGLGEREVAEHLARHEAQQNRVTAACRAQAAERPEELAALVQAIEAARAALARLEAALNARVMENGVGVRFKELDKVLSRLVAPLAAAQAQTITSHPPSEATAMTDPVSPAPALNGAHPAPPAGGIPGSVNSRRDVERCLDMIIDFYERTEPSSPIPHLARRMRKMVPMNFLQLMEEIAPSGMKEFKNVAGVDDKKSASQ